jgi:hypothetical protein
VAHAGSLVGVVDDANLYRTVEVAFGFEEVARAEKRFGRPGAVDTNIHVCSWHGTEK